MVALDPVLIRGPKFLQGGPAPLLLERTDARFMGNVRDELGAPARLPALKKTILDQSRPLKLFQPVHRTFYIALTELVCDVAGGPRLDAAKVESAGLVVRRVEKIVRGKSTPVHEGWMQAEDGATRWVPFSDSQLAPTELDPDADPAAARRLARTSGNAELDRRLVALRSPSSVWSEVVTDLFVLPPKVAEATRATLLFGMVPTTSISKSPAPPAEEFDDDDILNASYPLFLQAGSSNLSLKLPQPGEDVPRPPNLREASATLREYVAFVEQMVIQFDLLGDTPAAGRLRDELNRIRLPFPNVGSSATKPMAEHLEEAARVLVFGPETGANSFRMPGAWVRPDQQQQRAILNAVKDSARQKLDSFRREEAQFDAPGDRYRVRAFVRVRRDDGCPSRLFWTNETASFEIAPWYESGPGPMPVVQLPDPFGPGGLSRFKPNVGFSVPSSIADVIRSNTPDDLINGKGGRGSPLGIGWLCGFNIPLITLCAFLVLSIFLSLFQIIFWWLAFIKICIPIPKRQP